jgi:hypothetical protein
VDSPILPGFQESDPDDQTPEEASIALDTFLGNSIIPRTFTWVLSKNSGVGPGGSGTSYSWSRGLGFETSPIKTRSVRKKATLSRDSFEVVTISTGSDTVALRGLKSLARNKT